jgi:hypothetical protein
MKLLSRLSLLSAVFAVAGPACAQAGVIYSTGFEAPTYSVGPLAGQDSWQAAGAGGGVENSIAASGSQAGAVPGGFNGQYGVFHSDPSAAQFIEVSADIDLQSSSSQGSWQFATLGAGLHPFFAGIDIDGSTGDITEITKGFASVGTLSRDVFHNIDLKMNFGADTYSLSIDGVLLGSNLPFCGDNGPCTTPSVGSYDSVFFDTFGSPNFNDTGLIDNVVVQTFSPGVPEPATWAMVLLGVGAVGSTLRFARRSSGAASAAM